MHSVVNKAVTKNIYSTLTMDGAAALTAVKNLSSEFTQISLTFHLLNQEKFANSVVHQSCTDFCISVHINQQLQITPSKKQQIIPSSNIKLLIIQGIVRYGTYR